MIWALIQKQESKQKKNKIKKISMLMNLFRYILSWTERYRKGVQPYAISLPKKK